MRLAVAALAAALCVAAAQTASASPTRTPSPKAATAAFGRLLRQLYGESHGYWTCPGPAILGRVDCIAEIHTGRTWHQVYMSARWRHGVIVLMTLTNVGARSWVRHWWPYSRHFILRSGEPQVQGVISVNSPAYDWGWLALGAEGLTAGQTRRVGALDGYYGKGVQRFYVFTCRRRGGPITCRNALGDAMRYRPHSTT